MDGDITNAALNVDRIIKGKIKQLSGNSFPDMVACVLLLILKMWNLQRKEYFHKSFILVQLDYLYHLVAYIQPVLHIVLWEVRSRRVTYVYDEGDSLYYIITVL